MSNQVPQQSLEGVTQAWVRTAARGDADGFAQLYEHIAPAVFTWASLRLRGDQLSLLDAGDLVQEVWLRAWRKIEDLDVEATPFRFWIFRIAKNVLLEASRQARKPDRRGVGSGIGNPTGGDDLDPMAQVPDSITGVSRRMARSEDLSRFKEAVEAMEAEERKLVIHCGLEGLPLKEVGVRLGISEEAAGKRWQRLRAKLRTSELPRYLLAE